MLVSEIKKALEEKKTMVWNDPVPVDGADYTITFVDDLGEYEGFTEEELEDAIILIQYNGGLSEAEVFPWEIALA